MAQATDYTIDNQVNPTFRSELNSILSAVNTGNSGSTQPTNPAQFMIWVDTSTVPATRRIRNAANSAWIAVGQCDTTNWGFVSAASPTFTGTVTIPTPAAGTNNTQAASTAYVRTEIANHGSWLTLPVQNAWAATSGGNYRIQRDGMVTIRATLSKANPISAEIIAILPPGARPSQTQQFFGRVLSRPEATITVATDGSITLNWTPITATIFIELCFSFSTT